MKIVQPTAEGIAIAGEALQRGEIVAYPTETVYGLGVDPMSRAALDRLYALKGRDRTKPMLVVIADEAQLRPLVETIPPQCRPYIEACWPGPLSMLFPMAAAVPKILGDPGRRICVRCTALPAAQALCRAFGGALVSTSANLSGKGPARTLDDVPSEKVSVGINGGTLKASLPSTVFDPVAGLVLREGAISESELMTIRVD